MKKSFFLLALLLPAAVITDISCKKSDQSQPCDGKGTICFTNKRDSLLVINIVQIHTTINLLHDQMQCQYLAGNTTYTVKYSGPAYTGDLKDTTILVQNCDNKNITIQPPPKK